MFKILVLSRNQHHHFAHLYNEPTFNVIETAEWTPEEIIRQQPDILLTPSADSFESYQCLIKARELEIPTLYCPDGIIEWKHTWQNPRYGAGGQIPYQQPVMADKISCMGLHSFMLLESFGNEGRCELIGSPRFNHYLPKYNTPPKNTNGKTILVATANTYGFNDEQRAFVEAGLTDLKHFFEEHKTLKPIWRIQKSLKEKLQIVDEFTEYESLTLADVLPKCDAVITTQSTLILEAWLNHLPLATLNYGGYPEYINPAWRITNANQINTVIQELLLPSPDKIHFQDTQLHLNLLVGDAAQKQIELIQKMIELRRKDGRINYTKQLMPIAINNNIEFNRSEMYPDHPLFKIEANDLYQQLGFLKEENLSLKTKLSSRNLYYWLDKFLQTIYKKWK